MCSWLFYFHYFPVDGRKYVAVAYDGIIFIMVSCRFCGTGVRGLFA